LEGHSLLLRRIEGRFVNDGASMTSGYCRSFARLLLLLLLLLLPLLVLSLLLWRLVAAVALGFDSGERLLTMTVRAVARCETTAR
jgi:hypothetical protein